MSLDPKIEEAIQAAVKQEGQSEVLARRLVAWMKAIVSGNENVNSEQSANRHLELLYDATKVDSVVED